MVEFEEITSGLRFPEGPIAMPDGSVILVEMFGPRITRVLSDGSKQTVAEIVGGPNGAAIGPDGALYLCNNGGCFTPVDLGGLLLPGPPRYDLARMVARKNKVVASLVKGIATLFNAWKIEVVEGRGVLTDARTIAVTAKDGAQRQVQADAILIATGSSWPNLAQFPVDGKTIITSKQALDLESAPSRMIILGAGVEGCECASLFSGLGTQVTMVELQAAVLPLEDDEVSVLMARELKKRGVDVRTGTTIQDAQVRDGLVVAHLKDGSTVEAEMLLVSIGRGFQSRDIGAEQARIALGRRGEILVDDKMETNVPGVYAIGDVVGKAMLAHVASAACTGHCYDFGNYEPATGQFRLHVAGDNGVVAWDTDIVKEIEAGTYVVGPGQTPVYSVCAATEPGRQIGLRKLSAGEKMCKLTLRVSY